MTDEYDPEKAHGYANPAWDRNRKAAFAVLLGMAYDLGFGEGGVGEAVRQAREAIDGATAEDLADLLAGDEAE